MPDNCPESDEPLSDLSEGWYVWYKYQWDPYCESIYNARRAHGLD